MDDKGNLYNVKNGENGKIISEDLITKEVKVHDKLPQLFKIIPLEDVEKVKAMGLHERLEYYNKVLRDKTDEQA